MSTAINTQIQMAHDVSRSAQFPQAPTDWTPQEARDVATAEGIALTGEHWEVVRALHDYFARHTPYEVNLREVHDALEECFHSRGGMKFLYRLFPGGPLAQGLRIAGLPVPAIAVDLGFGSVM